MRVNDDYQTWNAASELEDPSSVLAFYKSALKLRKTNHIFVSHPLPFDRCSNNVYHQTYGDFRDISNCHPQVFGYLRTLGTTEALILLNFQDALVTFDVEGVDQLNAYKLVLGNYQGVTLDFISGNPRPRVELRGYEGRIYLKN